MVVQIERSVFGNPFVYTYSDAGKKITRDGQVFDSVYDPIAFKNERVYTETNIPADVELPEPNIFEVQE